MNEIREMFSKCFVLLALGVIIGLVFPVLASSWMFLAVVPGVIIVTELVGWLGFGDRWHDYRSIFYGFSVVSAVLICIGVFLGAGKIGTLLIHIVTLGVGKFGTLLVYVGTLMS